MLYLQNGIISYTLFFFFFAASCFGNPAKLIQDATFVLSVTLNNMNPKSVSLCMVFL